MQTPKLSLLPYKGTRDFYPRDMKLRNWFFGKIKEALARACFEEYNGPMLESLDLYIAKSGEEIANEQTYHFEDRGGRQLAVRPEMTPTVARLVAAKIGELNFPLRWFPSRTFTVTSAPSAAGSANTGRSMWIFSAATLLKPTWK